MAGDPIEPAEPVHRLEHHPDIAQQPGDAVVLEPLEQRVVPPAEALTAPLPNDADWRTKGAVTPVRNQGQCGGCWAFGAVGAIEGATQIAGRGLIVLSPQQLIDCDNANEGCEGGFSQKAVAWVARNGGICAESSYPYTGRDGRCASGCPAAATARGSTKVANSDSAVTTALNGRPCGVAIEASSRSFQSYRSGVFSGPCTQQLDHEVLAVGWTPQAYIVKNSWGTSWGEQGYVRMSRQSNTCGVRSDVYYANV